MPLESKAAVNGVCVELAELIEIRSLIRPREAQRKQSLSMVDGSGISKRRGRGMEFAEVRPYQAGDDIRNIDWRVTARTQETYTKLFQEEKERPVYIVVDQRSPMFFGSRLQFKSVLATKLAAYLAWSTFKQNDNLGAFVFGNATQEDYRAKRGKRAVLRFLNALTEFNGALATTNEPLSNSLASMISEVRRIARPGSQLYIISDFHDFSTECEKDLSRISQHSDVELLHIFDPIETELPHNTRLGISNGESEFLIDTHSKAFARDFQNKWNTLRQRIADASLQTRASYRALSTTHPLAEHIQNRTLGTAKALRGATNPDSGATA